MMWSTEHPYSQHQSALHISKQQNLPRKGAVTRLSPANADWVVRLHALSFRSIQLFLSSTFPKARSTLDIPWVWDILAVLTDTTTQNTKEILLDGKKAHKNIYFSSTLVCIEDKWLSIRYCTSEFISFYSTQARNLSKLLLNDHSSVLSVWSLQDVSISEKMPMQVHWLPQQRGQGLNGWWSLQYLHISEGKSGGGHINENAAVCILVLNKSTIFRCCQSPAWQRFKIHIISLLKVHVWVDFELHCTLQWNLIF